MIKNVPQKAESTKKHRSKKVRNQTSQLSEEKTTTPETNQDHDDINGKDLINVDEKKV